MIAWLVAGLGCGLLPARAGPGPAAGGGAPAAAAPAAPAPVGGPRGAAPARSILPDALARVPPDDPRMRAYSRGGYALFIAGGLWNFAVLLCLTASGLGARLQGVVERITTGSDLGTALYAVLLGLFTFAVSFPLALYGGFLRERAYGFATQTFGAWMADRLKGLGVDLALQAALVVALYAILRAAPPLWWAAGSALAIAYVVLGLAVWPVFIAPLFNTFTPLQDAPLRAEILEMARAQGIPAREVYQVDRSRQSLHTNAYVAGLLGTERIVLYDTLLERLDPREIRFIMGHEMGHYVLRHVWKTVALITPLIVLGLWLVDRLARRIIATHPALGIRGLGEPASLPLVLTVLAVYAALVTPLVNTYSRAQESAADRFGLEVTGDPEAAASSFIKFGRDDLSEYRVNPWIEALLYTHPSPAHRIEAAQAYARLHPRAGG
jgi:STE24 endopeptidase